MPRRRSGLGLVLALTLLSFLAAAETPRVLIYLPERTSPLVDEALIRIRGELGAVGLRVEVRPRGAAPAEGTLDLRDDDYGAIVLAEQGARIDIRAFARGLETPVSQSANPRFPGVDAEVVAVRAVEALRAAMVQYARNREAGEQPLPSAVHDFTRLVEPPARSTPAPEPTEPPAEALEPPPPPSSSALGEASPVRLWLGPVGFFERPAGSSAIGLQGTLWWHPSWLALGLSGQRTFAATRLTGPEGSALLERTSAQLLVGATRPLSVEAQVHLAFGLGVVQYEARPEAAEGYRGSSHSHLSPGLCAQIGASQWLSDDWGIYGALGLEAVTRAPRLRFADRDVAVAGRPTLTLGLGLVLGL